MHVAVALEQVCTVPRLRKNQFRKDISTKSFNCIKMGKDSAAATERKYQMERCAALELVICCSLVVGP